MKKSFWTAFVFFCAIAFVFAGGKGESSSMGGGKSAKDGTYTAAIGGINGDVEVALRSRAKRSHVLK